METIDRQKAARVWQRERGQAPAPAPEIPSPAQQLLALILQQWETAAVYRALLRSLPGKAASLRILQEQALSHCSCLKGIYALTAGSRPALRKLPLSQEDPERALRRCYGRTLHCLAQYRALSSDPEFGPVFDRLAGQVLDQCQHLLTLLGNLESK